ncbi:pilus assembly protein PilP [methane-oxidizing endosymbiont of Gigantopelta aegis]|uniref:pilus assembly protein PilP n=1 Tax=methane-oxidizing endosymbiont of Gigantopelta aegis TaxID=2794938 RepID=UPI0018DC89B3|nr:pilus assembly protein PilP [methane-oxidizing endosymbiont of Gigantopelta aegis]
MKAEMRLMRPQKSFSLCYWVMLIALTGCAQNDFDDLERYIAEVKARPKSAIEPLPEIKAVEPFLFNPEGLRDPFRPIDKVAEAEDFEIGIGSGIRPDITRRKEELEFYTLDSLRMVGTVKMDHTLWALIKAADGTIHRVKEGNHMGTNYGKIVRIQEDKIELTEIVPDKKPGYWREQQVTIALAE